MCINTFKSENNYNFQVKIGEIKSNIYNGNRKLEGTVIEAIKLLSVYHQCFNTKEIKKNSRVKSRFFLTNMS